MTSPFRTSETQPLGGISLGLEVSEAKTAPLDGPNADNPMPEIQISKPIKIAAGVSSNAKQHVLLVRDHSSSMSGTKIDELNAASQSLVQELANPQNKDGFRVSFVDFSSKAQLAVFAQPAEGLTIAKLNASGGTDFEQALVETISAAQAFQAQPNPQGWQYLRPQVLFLSDGQSQASDKIMRELQDLADVTSIAYGSDADVSMLSRISSDGQVHIIGTNGGELRKFLAEVGQTLSQALATR